MSVGECVLCVTTYDYVCVMRGHVQTYKQTREVCGGNGWLCLCVHTWVCV